MTEEVTIVDANDDDDDETYVGVSWKGESYMIRAFCSKKDALKWLYTEEYDFRERELYTYSEFCKLEDVFGEDTLAMILEDMVLYDEDPFTGSLYD